MILFHHYRSTFDFLLPYFFKISFHAVTYLLLLGQLGPATIAVAGSGRDLRVVLGGGDFLLLFCFFTHTDVPDVLRMFETDPA